MAEFWDKLISDCIMSLAVFVFVIVSLYAICRRD
jgi:hypothetical protein